MGAGRERGGAAVPLPASRRRATWRVEALAAALLFWAGLLGFAIVVLHGLVGLLVVGCVMCGLIDHKRQAAMKDVPPSLGRQISGDALRSWSDAVLRESFPPGASTSWTRVADGLDVHAVHVPCRNGSGARGALVLVHGVGSCAMLLAADVAGEFTDEYDVYAVDLPGFGVSSTGGLERADAAQSLGVCCAALEGFLAARGLEGAVLVAHSFGGFVGVHVAERCARVRAAVLINPAGLAPTLGAHGAMWAVWFKLGLPMSVLQLLGPTLAKLALEPVLHSAGAYTRLFVQVQAARSRLDVIGRFIQLRLVGARWCAPALGTAMRVAASGRLGLVWGREDPILPIELGRHAARWLSEAAGQAVPLVEIDEGHCPFSGEGAARVSSAVRSALQQLVQPGEAAVAASPLARSPGAELGADGGGGSEGGRVHELAEKLHCAPEMRTWSWFHVPLTRARINEAYDGAPSAPSASAAEQAVLGAAGSPDSVTP